MLDFALSRHVNYDSNNLVPFFRHLCRLIFMLGARVRGMTFQRSINILGIAVASITAIYALFNVVLMVMYAKSLLGPVPFTLIWFFLGVSILGAVVSWFNGKRNFALS